MHLEHKLEYQFGQSSILKFLPRRNCDKLLFHISVLKAIAAREFRLELVDMLEVPVKPSRLYGYRRDAMFYSC